MPWSGRTRLRWLWLWLIVASRGFAGWELTPPGDPNRFWGGSLSLSGLYDDNFNGTQTDHQSGYRFKSTAELHANVPIERLFVGLRYNYSVGYPRDLNLGGVDETHNLNLLLNYTFNPRLSLSLNETFVDALQPQLVLTQAGTPVSIIQAGTYIHDSVGGSLRYVLTPRWQLSLDGSWAVWMYDVPNVALFNDHEDYQATVAAGYTIDARTTVGLNYQYGLTLFTNPGPNNSLDAQSHSVYVSVVRRFNPQLSVQVYGGYTLRESDDGSASSAPYGYLSLVYSYTPDSTLSVTAGHTLSESTVGITRDFSSSENTTAAIQLNHRFTVRLRARADVTYTLSSFQQPLQTSTLKAEEKALTGHVGLDYAFTIWLSAVADYDYTQLITDLPNRAFDRNQVSIGLSASY